MSESLADAAEELHTFEHAGFVLALALSDGLLASGGQDCKVLLHDAAQVVDHFVEEAVVGVGLCAEDTHPVRRLGRVDALWSESRSRRVSPSRTFEVAA